MRGRYHEVRLISAEVAEHLDEFLPKPTEPWYVMSRRRGYHRALPPFDRQVIEDFPTGYLMVRDTAARTRYLRPRSKEWQAADEALA